MFDKITGAQARYEELQMLIADGTVIENRSRWLELVKEYNELKPIVELFEAHQALERDIAQAEALLMQPDMRELAEDELSLLLQQREPLSRALAVALLPRDPMDGRNAIVEIRGGAGGDEAALFAALLTRMYARFAEREGWRMEMLSLSDTPIGGVKEAVFQLSGENVFSRMKFESGVHRIQRVPVTESGGRIHTSTATVAVLAEAEEIELDIPLNEVRVDVFRSGGHGGQSVNTTDSAVRITHLPTGLVVSCQDEKSQLKNRDKAMRVLRARLLDLERQNQHQKMAENRKSQVGTGDRSERIRTYNFPDGRVTDHRIGLTRYNIEAVVDGELAPFIDALISDDQAKRLLAQA